ncbi:MAG: homoserine O-acetyltransferase, partial [Clostridia bacterium]|nr:homoserine O-acetyltransferase [Clostridia bacterium]
GDGDLAAACAAIEAKLLLIAFTSDWLYPPASTRTLAEAVMANYKPVSYIEIPSGYGHDAFLLEAALTAPLVGSFLEKV